MVHMMLSQVREFTSIQQQNEKMFALGKLSTGLNFLGNSLIAGYSKIGTSSYISLPASIGEIGTCLWLLIMGAKDKNVA
ncbi:MAG TPA: hypothetical protein VIJ75_04830 [Hanamia sp.]